MPARPGTRVVSSLNVVGVAMLGDEPIGRQADQSMVRHAGAIAGSEPGGRWSHSPCA
ncbi:hypothetical protein BRAS3843_3080003 [Bradyrhizobium sp. STM 3843]|nr:hypothetical protein BRAS3843_3080003 [Bradyrhizobium sp. STM 3843]